MARGIVASIVGLAIFLLLVVAQPLIEPAYDPLRQGVSEFLHTDSGWLDSVGFLAWASSLAIFAALLVSVTGDAERSSRLPAVALGVAVLGLVLVTIFPTDRGSAIAAEVVRSTTPGRIHDIGSALVSVGIFAAVLADGRRRENRVLSFWVIAVALVCSAVLLLLGDPLPGLRQRCLIAGAALWQLIVLRRLWRVATWDGSNAGSRCSTS